MKNKILYIYLSALFIFFTYFTANSVEQFNFDVTELEILENGNKFKGLKRGIITTDNGLSIEADEFDYNKILNILNGRGNIRIFDKVNNITIFTDSFKYLKNEETIISEGNSKALKAGTIITANKFYYKKDLNFLAAKRNVKINDTVEKILIFTEEIAYEINNEQIFTTGITDALIENKYKLNSKNVIFNRNLMELSSNNKTKVTDNSSNLLELDNFRYLKNKGLIKGKNLLLTTNYNQDKSDKYFFSDGFFDLITKNFTASNTTLLMHNDIFGNKDNEPRLKGVSSSKKDNITEINKGVFTSCKKNDDCPPWSLTAEKITHDLNKKQLLYDDAILKIYNKPVFYFPKFFHPDPSVERQSGILQPQLNSSKILGSSIQIPYFHIISDNKDFTTSVNLFDKDILLLQNEFRKQEKNSTFIADFGFTKGYESKLTNKKKNISHFFSKYELDLKLENFIDSDLSIDLQKITKDTYLSVFDSNLRENTAKPNNKNMLYSSINLSLNHEKYVFSTTSSVSEKLSGKNSDRYQYIIPSYEFYTNLNYGENFGSLNLNSSGSNNLKDTNNLRSRIINNINFNSNDLISDFGFKTNWNIYSKNLNTTANNDSVYKSTPQIELMNIFEVQTSLPLIKLGDFYDSFITPKASLRLNPGDMKNYSGDNRKISTSNLFSINRLGLVDTFESGESLTLGLDYKKENINDINRYFEIKLGSVFRNSAEKYIPHSSSINQKTGNLIGSVKNSINERLNINYDFSVDNNYNTIEYNSFSGNLNINKFQTSLKYIEENGKIGNTNSIENSIAYKFDEKNFFSFNTRRNRKINLTEYYDLVYEYKNDCLIAGLKYKKTYYKDRDITPGEDLMFTLTIFPLTTYENTFDRGGN